MIDWSILHVFLAYVQHGISLIGVLVIISGVLVCLSQYLFALLKGQLKTDSSGINVMRLNLGRVLILGLEFIVAADLIGTTTTPDYYAVGLLAVIVLVRTVLSFSINRELMSIAKE
ncbi:MAG TPA: DUF1622 domain-containing protein [Gammaproteobacteria bacterium]|jgi:uncharacterized membrane protein|nr:DUF1622 domain-containing protein [Gammaproteobacteria bacterium]